MLFHAYSHLLFSKNGVPDPAVPAWLYAITRWMGYGHFAVAVFIVLSGYCLMMPVARAPNGRLRGGMVAFIRRRSRRILPPYFAALFFSICLVYVGSRISAEQSEKLLAHLSIGSVLSHLLVLHNLQPIWSKTINPPMWSVGTEWDIYFIFALVLLPLFQRWGIWISVMAAFLIGLLPGYLLPASYNLSWACPWYTGLFALGMLGAVANFSP